MCSQEILKQKFALYAIKTLMTKVTTTVTVLATFKYAIKFFWVGYNNTNQYKINSKHLFAVIELTCQLCESIYIWDLHA